MIERFMAKVSPEPNTYDEDNTKLKKTAAGGFRRHCRMCARAYDRERQ